MKKNFLVVFSTMFIFALFGAVFALSSATNAGTEKSEDVVSCPLQKRHGSHAASSDDQKDSCCGMADCCKDGKCSMGGACCKAKNSCPMKQSKENESAQTVNMTNVVVAGSVDKDNCCQPGADCCKNGGACCHKKS